MHRTLLEQAAAALQQVLRFAEPADAVLNRFFRAESSLGRSERAWIAEGIFGVLRHKRVLDALTQNATPRALILAWLVKFAGRSTRELGSILAGDEPQWLARVKAAQLDAFPSAVRAELPDWIYERLETQLGAAETLALGRALQDPAPLDLRVNTLKAGRDEVLAVLRADDSDALATPHSPLGVRVPARTPINRHPLFIDGRVEVQDEGSQLIGYLVAPRRHERIVDFCAGAGGKSLMLGAMMHSQGRLYAFDTSAARLARLAPRLKRSGLSNLHAQRIDSERDTKVRRLAGKMDRVLVDAPCTGFGTLRRNPDLKWRQSPQALAEMRVKQASILRAAATLVKSGGRLVYATCSLLREENEDIVEAFLGENAGFTPLECGELLERQGIHIGTATNLRLWPHVHATDGFFAAALTRT